MDRAEYTCKIRERIIRSLWNSPPLTVRAVERIFDKSRRLSVRAEISLMRSEGIVNQIGLGTRGNPFKLLLSGTYPFNVFCPLCKQSITPKVTNEYS